MSRESIDLCGIWKFQPDPSGEGEPAGYFSPEYDDRLWRQARLPAVFEDCGPGLETYEGAGWFRRRLTVPAAWQGRRVVLRFQGAWYHTFRGEEYGLIHWVAVRRAHQGKGLGKAAVSFALDELAQWHDRVLLGTQTKRLPAIKLYLDFGFEPLLDLPGAVDKWRQVAAKLKHPALDNLSL